MNANQRQARARSERIKALASRHLLVPAELVYGEQMVVDLASDDLRGHRQILPVDSGVTIH